MPRYIVQRTFPDGLNVAIGSEGVSTCEQIRANNSEERVTWVQSFVSADKQTSFCLFEGPTPEAVRRSAQRNGWPIDSITEVRVLDPYFYY